MSSLVFLPSGFVLVGKKIIIITIIIIMINGFV